MDLLARLISRLRQQQGEMGEAALKTPLSPDKYLIQVGRFQGIQEALDILEGLLDDTDETERNS